MNSVKIIHPSIVPSKHVDIRTYTTSQPSAYVRKTYVDMHTYLRMKTRIYVIVEKGKKHCVFVHPSSLELCDRNEPLSEIHLECLKIFRDVGL